MENEKSALENDQEIVGEKGIEGVIHSVRKTLHQAIYEKSKSHLMEHAFRPSQYFVEVYAIRVIFRFV